MIINSTTAFELATTTGELQQILDLQNSNLGQNLTPEEKKSNGFVTVKHNLELLTQMNNSAGQVIAKDEGQVVGYAIVMLKEFSELVPVLVPMFEMFNQLLFKQQSLTVYRYYVMGQICVAASHRGQGVFEGLYLKHKEVYAPKFDICLTEVSVNNTRSMRAHEKVGFKTIHTFKDKTDSWNIMVWDWK